MKKSIKILTLVLSLALICGALVVAAFADDTGTTITGIRLDASGDFESPKNTTITSAESGKQVFTNLDQDNSAKRMIQFKHQSGGEGKVVTNPIDNNTYITVDYSASNATSNHYISAYTAINSWGTYTTDEWEYYDEFKYYVVDFDVAWFDVDNYDGTGSFYPYTVCTNAAGSGRTDLSGKFGVVFSKVNGKVVAKFRGNTGETGYELGNDEWSHVTWIMEPIVFTDTDGTQNLKIKQYLAIDGEVVGTYEFTNAVAATSMYNGNRVRYYTLDVRFNPFGSKGSAGCADNYNFRTLMPEYNGNLATVLAGGVGADLTAFESSLYTDSYVKPAHAAMAKVGETAYTSVEAAIAAAAGTQNVVLQHNASNVVVDQVTTIECGTYTLTNPVATNGLVALQDTENNVWTFKNPEDVYLLTYTNGDTVTGIEIGTADAFKTAITNVTDGGVITLYNDVAYAGTATGNGAIEFSVSKSVTINLNGHLLDLLTTAKHTTFNVGAGKTFTILGEEEGSALIHGYSKSANSAGGTLFGSGDGSTITLKGKGLFVSCAALYGQWSDIAVTINIEDCYLNHNGATENSCNVYISNGAGTKVAFTVNIKNATVNGLTTGVNNSGSSIDCVINVENSVILSSLFASNSTYNPRTVVNVKGNSYIASPLTEAKAVNVTGENNYFTSSDWTGKATFESGVSLANEETVVAHTNYTHPWVVSAQYAEWDKEATLVISKEEVSKTYAYKTTTGPVEYFFEYVYDGETYSFPDLAQAISAAPAGTTITMLKDVTISATSTIVTINKQLTIDLGGYHLQVIQEAAGAQIVIATTSPVVVTNGHISCAASSEFRSTLTSTASNYDVGEPLFVANSVAVDFALSGVSTYTAGIFYNTVSGSKLTVTGGYHQQNSITYPHTTYLERGLVITKADATVLFTGASINIDWCGGLLISNATNKATFTYESCVVNFTGDTNQVIRVANDKTFVYFKDSDVYGAFVKPVNKSGSAFSSANLNFDENCTWGYPSITGKTLITPTLPAGYVLLGSSATVSLTEYYAISGKIHLGTFAFPETASSKTISVSYRIADASTLRYMVTSGSTVTYYEDSTTLSSVITAASAGSTITLLKDVTEQPTAAISIGKALTFDLNGKTLTLCHSKKELTFTVKTTSTVKFMNGNVATETAADGYVSGSNTYENTTFAFVYVTTGGANLVFDDVNGTVSALTYCYGANYTITVNGGTYRVIRTPADMNTSGFICGQANINATVTGATIYAEKASLIGSSSYRQIVNLNNTKASFDEIKAALSSTFIFNDCKIAAPSVTTDLITYANEYTKVELNGCYVYGSISSTKIKDSTIYYLYNAATGKVVTSASALTLCTCGAYADTGNDGKCDSCKNYNPDYTVSSYKAGACPAANITIGEETYFSTSANLTKTTLANSYLKEWAVSETKTILGASYTFDCKADYVKITWYDEKGAVIEVTKVDPDFTTLAEMAPEYEGTGGVTNGWYKIGGYVANSWTSYLGGTVAVDLGTVDLSVNNAFYPQANGENISAYLSAAMYNLSIAGSIRNNFYIPETPDNVEILGVYVGDREINGSLVLYRDHNNDPVYYNMYVINGVGATEFTKVTEVTVKYTVDGIELEQLYTLSPEKYANIIYNDSQKTEGNAYNGKAYNVVADLVRYSYLLSVYANVEDDGLTALYDKMSGLCSTLPTDNSLAGSTANVANLSGMGSIAFEASSYNPRWKFTLNESAQVVEIKITLDGYYNYIHDDRTNYGAIVYSVGSIVTNSEGYITSAYTGNIPAYNLNQMFTITLVKADGTEVSGTYDMKTYYTAIGKDTAAADFLKSAVALSNSTLAYKFPEGKVTASDVADFWGCDHEGQTAEETVVSGNYVFKPHYCQKCDAYLFYYEDYGAVADGVTNRTRATHVSGTNDYEAIYWTHANANEWKNRTDLSGDKRVAVIGNATPSTAKYYYISLPEGRGLYQIDSNSDGAVDTVYKNGENLGTIIIATDTSWNGVHLIIDDDAICNAGSSCTCGRYHNDYKSQSIFKLDEYGSEVNTESWTGTLTSISAGATNIGFQPGRKMLVYLKSTDRKIYYRYGSNASNGVAINEIILVDEFGNVDPTTPVQWDYDNLTTVTAYAVDTDAIKVSGLDASGVINSSFESYVNNSTEQSIPKYTSCTRNIAIQRSNATVEGIQRYFTEEASTDSNERYAYTFIDVQWCSKATVKDMIVRNHNNQKAEDGINQGSYEFSGGDANAVSWINCRTVNMFSDSSAGALIAYPEYRGLFGTNRIRNMYLEDCYLNSFDAHTGAYNVEIVNSTFEHMNFIGGGQITLKDVTVYSSKNYGSALNFRTDYGSTWNGDLDIDGLTIMYSTESSYKPSRITLFYGSYVDQYWGMDTYTPQNVTINDFHVQGYTATVSDGVRTETLGAIDSGDIDVYYYYALHELDSVPDVSAAGEHGPTDKGDSSIDYDYGTNHLEVTKNITITNSVSIKLPVGEVWQGMNVTVDGSKYVYYEKSIFGYVYESGWKAE